MEPERDVAYARTQCLAGGNGTVDCRRERKDAGKECVQRAAIIGVVACAGVRMGASVVTMAVSVMVASLMAAAAGVTGMRNGSSGSRVSL